MIQDYSRLDRPYNQVKRVTCNLNPEQWAKYMFQSKIFSKKRQNMGRSRSSKRSNKKELNKDESEVKTTKKIKHSSGI